jgi:hypothetical protein
MHLYDIEPVHWCVRVATRACFVGLYVPLLAEGVLCFGLVRDHC